MTNSLSSLKREVHALIEADRLKQALTRLSDGIDGQASRWRNDLTGLKRRFNQTNRQKMAGTISREQYELSLNQLTEALMALLDELQAEDLASAGVSAHDSIANSLLLIGHDVASLEDLDTLFQQLNFTTYQTCPVEAVAARHDLNEFELVVVDNTDLPYCPAPPEKMQGLSDEAKAKIQARVQIMTDLIQRQDITLFLVHYGEQLYWINDRAIRNRVHPANSKFALYARVREALAFLTTIQV